MTSPLDETNGAPSATRSEETPCQNPTRIKVCLVNPSVSTAASSLSVELILPLGIAYLAGHLDREGFGLTVVDAIGEGAGSFHPLPAYPDGLLHGLTHEETAGRIPDDAAVVGISCMFSVNWVTNRDTIRAIRSRHPDVVIVIGGEHATAMAEYCLRDAPEIDFVVLGEGENTMADLLSAMEKGTDPADVSGLAFMKDGVFQASPPRPRERELDVLPWPAWRFLNMETYLWSEQALSMGRAHTMSVIASRGCPYACTFCSSPGMWGRMWRARSPADVADEIEYNVRTYGIKHVDFFDLTMITKKRWIVDFCEEMIARDLNVAWEVNTTRSEAIDGEVTRLLKKAGCAHVTYALESGSDKVLTDIKKQLDKAALLHSVKQASAAGLQTKINFVVGFPDDTLGDILQSYKMAILTAWNGAHDTGFFPFSAYPGSALFHRLVDEKRIHLDDQYFIGLANYNFKNLISFCSNLSATKIRYLCLLGIMIFYAASFSRHPRRIFRFLKDYLGTSDRSEKETRLATALVYLKNKKSYLKRTLNPAE